MHPLWGRAWSQGLSLGVWAVGLGLGQVHLVEALGSSSFKHRDFFLGLSLSSHPCLLRPGLPPLKGSFLLGHFLPALEMIIGFLGKR